MDAPRNAAPGEFAAVMDFIDQVFRPGQTGTRIMHGQYPHLYRPDAEHMGRSLVLYDAGTLVGHLAVHPVGLRLGGVTVWAGGVGGVAAHPDRRGEGIMTALLAASETHMRALGFPLSILGGDRQRYGWCGWENGGRRTTFALTPRSLGRATAADLALPLRRLRWDAATRRRIWALERQRPYGAERSLDDLRYRFERTSREAWECRDAGRFAYVVLGGPAHQAHPYERLDEFGGDPALVLAMVRQLMAQHEVTSLRAVVGPHGPDLALLRPVASSWHVEADGMVRILDLATLVAQLAPVLRRRHRRLRESGSIEFGMADSGQRAILRLGPGSVRRVRLSDRDMVTLFFGLHPAGEVFAGRPAARLDGMLPLPLFVPPLDHV
jgi:predicted N-acetyltransferase YhbS